MQTLKTNPTDGLGPQDQIGDADMRRFIDLIYERTGIRIPPQKKMLMSNRLKRRMRHNRIATFAAYFEHLTKQAPNSGEWEAFVQEITTHETYLFRDPGQWQWFRQTYLPAIHLAATGGKRDRSLRIWSAACSTGDEAYTIASCVAASLPNHRHWKVRIIGTDIGIGAVEAARYPRFNSREMHLVPADVRKAWFETSTADEFTRPRAALTEMTSFRTHNLMRPLQDEPFDLVFLKNVLIYFDEKSKSVVAANVMCAIKREGYLIAGSAEGVGEHLREMRRESAWLFQRV
ncbi:MAG: protein-glutamate O-methyltransferase CheR [Pirellulales bacterium]